MNVDPIRVLIIDDSAIYRQSIQNVLREVAGATVVGVAKDGVDALQKIEQLDPDLLTLDVQMPDMNGIEVLREIKRRQLRPKSIMVSSYTAEGAQVTMDALMEGALDFILKPASADAAANRQTLQDELAEKIAIFRESTPEFRIDRGNSRGSTVVDSDVLPDAVPAPPTACRAVILGCSTGGPQALKAVLPKLPAQLPVPIFVVQHMPARYTQSLAARLNDVCELEVVEACDGMTVPAGQIVVAPGGKQMKVEGDAANLTVRVNDDPPERGTRPSVDYTLRSATQVLSGNLLAVIMTGMGRDGMSGCDGLKQAGGYVFAQHQDDCVVYGMPKAVIEQDLADRVLPLAKIAPAIARHVRRSRHS
ncbi:MAG: protein-glutamate methylesterase/protein-glutamine glutaminase [Bythopirellula sp.]